MTILSLRFLIRRSYGAGILALGICAVFLNLYLLGLLAGAVGIYKIFEPLPTDGGESKVGTGLIVLLGASTLGLVGGCWLLYSAVESSKSVLYVAGFILLVISVIAIAFGLSKTFALNEHPPFLRLFPGSTLVPTPMAAAMKEATEVALGRPMNESRSSTSRLVTGLLLMIFGLSVAFKYLGMDDYWHGAAGLILFALGTIEILIYWRIPGTRK